MTVASGVYKIVAYKEESSYGQPAGASGATLMRRIQSTLAVTKETYESEEIESHQQVGDMRHGTRRVAGTISSHIAPGAHKDWFAALFRKAFVATTAVASLSLTIAASGSNWTITRSTGSFISDGLKIGDVVRITAGAVNAANLNKNLLIVSMTTTALTVAVLNRSALVAEGPVASCTITLPGKKTMMAESSQTDKSFNVEHWHSDIGESELYTGLKPQSASFNLPPTGMTRFEMPVSGFDVTTAQSRYFTSPSAASSAGVTAAVNGYLLVGGTQLVAATGMTIEASGNVTGDAVVGENRIPSQDLGRMRANGQLTVKFDSVALRDAFIGETEVSIVMILTTSNAAAADFITFVMPRVKLGGANKDDGEKALIQTTPYVALFNAAGGSGTSSDKTTLSMQDSLA